MFGIRIVHKATDSTIEQISSLETDEDGSKNTFFGIRDNGEFQIDHSRSPPSIIS